ncbi:hypothetical protein PACTADRAFT_83126 [Pachysolen tannophilus NRRL Y-2460]|uniref:Potassium transport protein n=1 Tax=Pachysolen tannophilus NRRL Y-2460 TaxID=669874 RepID=A0A1E4U115_PACTA|nr:hypothetical protein PACTADRAFT_83126 [Pachysolen tannophilus NRRL Y-2460]
MIFKMNFKVPRIRNKALKGSYGFRIRNKIGSFEKKFGSKIAKIIPSFIVAHYYYIILMIIITSVLIYPQKNIAYIDALVFATGSCTQAGLNTVNVNNLTLFQQMVIYSMCFFTTPIFIHGFILYLRFYWFERYFDGIKESSKLNYKMRRTATLATYRTQTMDNDNTKRQEGKGINSLDDINSTGNHRDNYVEHLSEPSDPSDESDENNQKHDIPVDGRDIKFADLPNPRAIKDKTEIEPKDMLMSIALMQKNHDKENDESGPALVINGPAERERKKRRHHKHKKPHYKKFVYQPSSKPKMDIRRPSIQFDVPEAPSRTTNIINSSEDENNDNNFNRNRFRFLRGNRNSSNHSKDHPSSGADNDHYMNRNEEVFDSSSFSSANDNEEAESDGDIDEVLARAQTNISASSATSSQNNYNGFKLNNKAKTFDVNESKKSGSLRKSPTFEKSALRNFNRRKVGQRLRRLSRYSSSVFENKTSDDDRYDLDEEKDLLPMNSVPAMSTNYLSWTPTIARNSTFVALSESQKEELGGVEYRAVKLLIKIVTIYYIGFHIFAIVCFLPWILVRGYYIDVVRDDGVSPTWWSIFHAASAFNDLGFTLTPDSMMSFYENVYVLLMSSFFIVVGNTGFPVMLRFIIWLFFKISPPLSLMRESLGFLLDHPRRCFTLLFPSVPTWWLFSTLVLLNGTDLVLFFILDLNNKTLTTIPTGFRIIDGLFQAISTRTAGFTVVNLADLHPSVQVSYMLMMYISVLPLAISIRRTNVYEEQSLGVYSTPKDDDEKDNTTKTFIGTHLRKQLSFDLWFIFLGLFIICIVEGSRLESGDINFTIFQILFEIVSAYSCVGLSLGYPNTDTSFCAQFSTISKLVIIFMMVRGRHRGLPYALDRAILLPSDKLQKIDAMQEKYNFSRTNTNATSAKLNARRNSQENKGHHRTSSFMNQASNALKNFKAFGLSLDQPHHYSHRQANHAGSKPAPDLEHNENNSLIEEEQERSTLNKSPSPLTGDRNETQNEQNNFNFVAHNSNNRNFQHIVRNENNSHNANNNSYSPRHNNDNHNYRENSQINFAHIDNNINNYEDSSHSPKPNNSSLPHRNSF